MQHIRSSRSLQDESRVSNVSCRKIGPWVAVANVQGRVSDEASIEAEVQGCFHELQGVVDLIIARLVHQIFI
jgi:hypothetical protein